MQRLEDLKLQLRSSSGSDGSSSTMEAGEELILQSGLSAAAAVLQDAESHDTKHSKQKQHILEQQRLQSSLPHLHLQLELYAADAAAPMLSLHHEAEIMAAAQQGRYITAHHPFIFLLQFIDNLNGLPLVSDILLLPALQMLPMFTVTLMLSGCSLLMLLLAACASSHLFVGACARSLPQSFCS